MRLRRIISSLLPNYPLWLTVVVIISTIILFAVLFILFISILFLQNNTYAILIPIVATLTGVLLSLLVGIIYGLRQKKPNAERTLETEPDVALPMTNRSRLETALSHAVLDKLLLENLREKNDELARRISQLTQELLFTQEQLLVMKRRNELEKQEQSIEWQKEAVTLVDVSPRAAIIIAWIGIEKQLQQIARLLEINVKSFDRPIDQIRFLSSLEKIDRETEDSLLLMSNLRNQIVHGVSEEEVTRDTAITFVQQAIEIAEKLSSIEASSLSK